MYIKVVKPTLDFLLAIIGLIILAIPMLIVSLVIVIDSKGSPIFIQKRIGINSKRFNIFKFRTMASDTPADMPTHMLSGATSHITKVGNFLRKTSIDELPQLFNVINGNMSFVGPRPALYNQYDLEEARIKNGSSKLKPGITGLAQVNGRDELPIEVKANYDGEYYKNIGFFYDIKILFMTFGAVIGSRGVKEGVHTDNDKD